MDFQTLVQQLQNAHQTMQLRAGFAVNQGHTLRNWLFGYHIVEFEQNGRDYADYGSRLLYRLAEALKKGGIKGISYTNLTLFRKFHLFYPQIGELTSAFWGLDTGKKNTLPNLQALPEDLENGLRFPAEERHHRIARRVGSTS